MNPINIGSFPTGGLVTYQKPYMLADQAFSTLENAYVWRDRVIKREGLQFLGQLRRIFNSINFFPVTTNPWPFNLLTVTGYVLTADNNNPGQITTTYPHGLANGDLVIITGIVGATGYNNKTFVVTVVTPTTFTIGADATAFGVYVSGGFWISSKLLNAAVTINREPNAQLECGTLRITIAPSTGNETIYQDDGNGHLVYVSGTYTGSGTINYATGLGAITFTVAPPNPTPTIITYAYFPLLPAMGIDQREVAAINDEQEIFFDTRYAYIHNGSNFQEFIPGTSWFGSDADFFWSTNYRGSTPDARLFFTTNDVVDTLDPIRYTDGSTWTDFAPLVDATHNLYQARILIPYYGRLLALNVWEGTTGGGPGGAVNIFNRCRFSQIGNPVAADAWRSDQFGKGGFIDAPTNEAIISAIFFKNTLIVFFERTTWQLRYVGEYGLPFIWERISSDYGSESTFSTILFDISVLAIGDRAIISASSVNVDRIDLQIPDEVFRFANTNQGVQRVCGIRDFKRELVFWAFADSANENEEGSGDVFQKFPNKVLLYNYRNNTYAEFRDSVTCFGTFQTTNAITWDSQDIFWDDEDTTWDDPDEQELFPFIAIGNQQGYISLYGYVTPDEVSLSFTAITFGAQVHLKVPNHNLFAGEIIYVKNAVFNIADPGINDRFFQVVVIDANNIGLQYWTGTNYADVSITSAAVYRGCGQIILFPKLNVITKDFNPYQNKGLQLKMNYLDFLTDATNASQMTVKLFLNSALSAQGNVLTGNTQSETFLPTPYYIQGSEYAWHRFFATLTGQFIRIQLTYDDSLMNDLTTHRSKWTLNAMTLWSRPAGKTIF